MLADLMTEPERTPLDIYYARQALLAISWSVSMMGDLDLPDDRMADAATDIALGILDRLA
ncbi:hypothetical protein [Nocardia caishijiensis]|uniref:hypothetical protein n=1 Tax=Nocardia caishijiensis TaxID=184756 RepID=UPI0008303F1D|nr:hypothetical protein [Nocardia caishijiensis]